MEGPHVFFLACLTELRLGSPSFFLRKNYVVEGRGVGRRTGGCGIRCRRNCGGKRVRETRDEEGDEKDDDEEAAWAAEERERERERERKGRPKLPAQSQVAATCLILNSVDACVRWEMQMLSDFSACKTVLRRASCGP